MLFGKEKTNEKVPVDIETNVEMFHEQSPRTVMNSFDSFYSIFIFTTFHTADGS